MWADRRILDLFGVDLPIVQAPMAGSNGSALAIAVSQAGGLGSLPCAMLAPAQMRAELETIRAAVGRRINLNFFCHTPPGDRPEAEAAWRRRLAPLAAELGVADAPVPAGSSRAPFDDAMCECVEAFAPAVVSFHFGLPARPLLERVRAAGAKIVSSATTVDEALWLEAQGCDAVIAQGLEAGGHRGMFRARDTNTQVGLFALLPQIVDAVRIPVIAAGAVADARGIVAAMTLGAAAAQIGTAYLFTPEATLGPVHRDALAQARDASTALTNVFSGRPARGIVNRLMREFGPMAADAPPFPLASNALAPLRAAAERAGSGDCSPLWAGQAVALGRAEPAGDLTRRLAREALALQRSRGGV